MPHLTMSDGTQIYYEDHGTGETVLFCHGLQSSHLKSGSFIGEFKGGCRCVCYDQRGHGASEHVRTHMNVQRLGKDLH